MAFFRSYLIENREVPDTIYDELDETALVLFLLQARLQGSASGVNVPSNFTLQEEMPSYLSAPALQQQLKFISGFLCFFIGKPMAYMQEMRAFRNYFIPGFAKDIAKQIQLRQALRKPFFSATLDDLQNAQTLDRFFDIAEISRLGVR